jgi:DNA-binding response OmpR family regulator
MAPRKSRRTVHWRWEYRLRHRPHVLLVAEEESVIQLRLLLQSRWLCSVASDLELGLTLASLLLPSRIVIDASVRHGTLLIERLKRHRDTHALPVLWLARDEAENARGCAAGAQIGLVTPAIGYEFDVRPVQQALFDMKPSAHSEQLSHS